MMHQSEFTAAIGDWSLVPPDPRFRIYRNNVASALINALRVRYPATERVLGRDGFAALAGHYAVDQRPASPVLIDYGGSFPEFIAAAAGSEVPVHLADLARLESLWWLAYHAADDRPLPPEELASIPADCWATARFRFLPSLGLIASAHAIGSIWQGESHSNDPQNIVIARPDAEVSLQLISPSAYSLVSSLRDDLTLTEAIEIAADRHGPFDLAPTLQGLLSLRIITGVST